MAILPGRLRQFPTTDLRRLQGLEDFEDYDQPQRADFVAPANRQLCEIPTRGTSSYSTSPLYGITVLRSRGIVCFRIAQTANWPGSSPGQPTVAFRVELQSDFAERSSQQSSALSNKSKSDYRCVVIDFLVSELASFIRHSTAASRNDVYETNAASQRNSSDDVFRADWGADIDHNVCEESWGQIGCDRHAQTIDRSHD